MFSRSRRNVLFLVNVFLTSIMLMSCSHGVVKTQVEITTSKANLINSIEKDITAEQFNVISNRIVSETQSKLLSKGVVSSTAGTNNLDNVILMIDYEYLETDSMPIPFGRRNVFAMKGKFRLIDPKTNQVLYTDSFDEIEDKISEFINSVSDKISMKVVKYLGSKS